jgi:hypothetical protein
MSDDMNESDRSLLGLPVSGQNWATPVATPLPSWPRRHRATLWAAGLVALLLITALSGRREEWLTGGHGPEDIARAQIEDLGRGQVRAAYDLFSVRYRAQVPFQAWRDLALSHARMFRTRELHLAADQESGGRAMLEAHLVVESGDRYVARFTLIRAGGQWWVDDLHWAREDDDRGRITAERWLTLCQTTA